MSEVEEKKKKSMEVEAALDEALEMYRNRLGFNIKHVRGNGQCSNAAFFTVPLSFTSCR